MGSAEHALHACITLHVASCLWMKFMLWLAVLRQHCLTSDLTQHVEAVMLLLQICKLLEARKLCCHNRVAYLLLWKTLDDLLQCTHTASYG